MGTPRPAPSSSGVGRRSGRLLSRSFSPVCVFSSDRGPHSGGEVGRDGLILGGQPPALALGSRLHRGSRSSRPIGGWCCGSPACVLSPLLRLSGRVALLSCLHRVVARGRAGQGHRLLQMAFQAARILEGRGVEGVGGVLQQEADPFPGEVPTQEPGAWDSAGPAHKVTPNSVRFPELPPTAPLAASIRVRGSTPWRWRGMGGREGWEKGSGAQEVGLGGCGSPAALRPGEKSCPVRSQSHNGCAGGPTQSCGRD